tara:strand:+ start:11624 stop:13534 length:1911 start_codon:yes stop_codon:yes gene_type:complete
MENFNNNLTSLFETRDKSLTKINEAVDYLSRSTRENLAILKIDNEANSLSMVSESDNLVSCSFEKVNDTIRLFEFKTTQLSEVLSDEYMDNYTQSKVSDFVGMLRENNYEEATSSFEDLLESFTNRSQANDYRAQVQKAKDSLDKNIFSPNNDKFQQIKDLTESIKSEITNLDGINMDVVNALKLNNAISKAYNLPKQDSQQLSEMVVPNNPQSDVYQMICENELVRKEIINAKGNLSKAWHNNEFISELASCIYEGVEKIEEKLIGVVEEIPYFALASKREIQEVLASTYDVINPGHVSTKDIKSFTSKIFELKKPVKEIIVEMLNVKYGININNLKMIPSFKTLAETQASLFTSISEHLTDGGINQKTAKEFGSYLKNKSGVAILDVSDFISDIFEGVEFDDAELNYFMKPVNLTEAVKDMISGKGDDEEGEERDGEEEAPSFKKLKSVAKKAKDLAIKMKGGKPEEEDKEGDDTESDLTKDEDGDGDVDKIDKKIGKEKKGVKKAKKEKQAADEKVGKEPPSKKLVGESMDPMAAGEEVVPEEDPDSAMPDQPAISQEEIVDLATDLEELFQDIDFSQGQSMSSEEETEEVEAAQVEERDEQIEQAKADLATAQSALEELTNETGSEEETEEV